MPRAKPDGAVNARVVQVVEFGLDPRGWSMFQALAGRAQRGMNGTDGIAILGEKGEPGRAFNGYAQAPQVMKGVAPLGQNLGGVRPVTPTTSEMSDQRAGATLDNSAMAIFAARMQQGRS